MIVHYINILEKIVQNKGQLVPHLKKTWETRGKLSSNTEHSAITEFLLSP